MYGIHCIVLSGIGLRIVHTHTLDPIGGIGVVFLIQALRNILILFPLGDPSYLDQCTQDVLFAICRDAGMHLFFWWQRRLRENSRGDRQTERQLKDVLGAALEERRMQLLIAEPAYARLRLTCYPLQRKKICMKWVGSFKANVPVLTL